MTAETSAASGEGPLAIICGGGSFPSAVADAVSGRGRRVVLFPLRGSADPAIAGRYPHHWVGLAQFGRFSRMAQAEGCRDVVLIGSVTRPAIRQLRPDLGTLRLVPRIVRLLRGGGDDQLLSGLGRIFEEHGFNLLGAHDVAPEITLPAGVIGRYRPGPRDLEDIAFGLSLLATMAPFDVGQAVVVGERRALAVEAAEGTDGMLGRVATLRREGRINLSNRVGVLVKAPKVGQERRIDLPSIGPRTVEAAAQAGLAGIAVIAGSTIAVEPERMTELADKAGLFVAGVRDDGTLD